MKALVYAKARIMEVREVKKPSVMKPTDAIIKVTSAAICGSDLHMYEGRTSIEAGSIFGHEILGVIDEVGPAVQQFKVGDRVVLPFNIACGSCFNCVRGYTNACYFYSNKGAAGAAYGFADMGPYGGGQAEYTRVPMVDFNAVKLPGKAGDAHEDDFLMLADIMPTAYHVNILAKVELGHSVVIYGAGPVGLLSIVAARLRGAADVYCVDHYESRLKKAKELGAIPINSDKGSPVEQIRALRKAATAKLLRNGEELLAETVLSGIDAVGYQAHDLKDTKHEKHSQVLEDLTELVGPTGAIGVIGVYVPADPGEKGDAANGIYSLPFGAMWSKGLTIGMGQCPSKNYTEALRNTIMAGHVRPGTIVSHHVTLDEAPKMYERFDKREEGVVKVVITFK